MNALDVAYMFAAGVTAPWWARKTRGGWDERLARTVRALGPSTPGRPRVLLHAVSVGETSALRQLVPLLVDRAEVVVTATTDTGMARARELYGPSALVLRYPLDLSGAVERFLDAVRPDVVGLVELEVWPNFLAGCARRGIPVAVINGRLSARSFRGYRRFRWAVTGMFRGLAAAAVQDEAYAERFIAMGTPRERVRVTGSMKWDSASFSADAGNVADLARALGVDRSRPVVVGGSTAEARGTSEEALLDAATPPGVQLVCAPRKPERFEEAYRALGGPARCVRRSNPGAYTGPRPAERFLLDTIGELRSAYALADVAVIGRSFGALHGSDPVEPIALGKATVMGPAAGDFLTTVEAFERAGAIVRCGPGDLAACVRGLLDDPDRRADLGRRGVACVRENQGASVRHAEILLELAKARRDGGGAATNDAPGRGQVVRTAQSPPEHTGGRLR
jgi:3-deoxy-D-manno-octulosonic-acid transferase